MVIYIHLYIACAKSVHTGENERMLPLGGKEKHKNYCGVQGRIKKTTNNALIWNIK